MYQVLGDSDDSGTIIIISVTIMTVIAKTYYHDSKYAVTGTQYVHISGEIDLEKELAIGGL